MDRTAHPVIVGVDGSQPSVAAADYAAQIATRRQCPLRLVHGYLHPLGYGALGFTAYTPAMPDPQADGAAMLDAVAADVQGRYAELDIDSIQLPSGGAAAVIDQSRTAEVVVVGCRGLGGFAGLLLGSVSSQVAAHAYGPVIVVRPAEPTAAPPTAPVVVGVDGSPGSGRAVEFAFTEAALRGTGLTALSIYWADPTKDLRQPGPAIDEAAGDRADQLVTDSVAPWLEKYPQVRVTTALIHQLNAEYSLVEASRDAGLVVVGARGRGGFTGLLLGSVSQALVHHAHCPVAVVHPRAHEREG